MRFYLKYLIQVKRIKYFLLERDNLFLPRLTFFLNVSMTACFSCVDYAYILININIHILIYVCK